MNYTIRNIAWALFFSLLLNGCVIHEPTPDQCIVKNSTIIKISEGTSFDIVFTDTNNDSYYINRGLERGLSIDDLRSKVLDKNVTLHLPAFGGIASEHIAQLEFNDTIIYTEFSMTKLVSVKN
ncbi:hypothetical protein [Altibacter sp.]|uniref:hypothetical protein n=1 Tax=Altibacter sp. TaxID=2024823 RepID=UPI000C99107C|nr:hypothetical protein [Altibacter sp.]MAP53664.1 hypothetical protein [Altibacter sp.]